MHRLESLPHTQIPLADGASTIPAVGFGTLIADAEAARKAIRSALEVGFRHIDGADVYRNEEVVGDALREAFEAGTVKRDELFVTSKLWNNNHRPERVRLAFERSLRRLQLDYLDCYLIHTPFAFQPGEDYYPMNDRGEPVYDPGVTLIDTWRAMESLVDEGRCRFIGLSDITLDKLKEIVEIARIKPAVVQVESHPYLPEWELLAFCQKHGIVLLAFAPLGHGMEPRITDDPVIKGIATRIGKTPAQVALAWAVQRGGAFLTTSTHPLHIRENFEIALLPQEAMQEIQHGITTHIRLNAVVETGMPGFVPRAK
ncbi:MAG TPA: aldo/keto reductase [Dyella sp.]|uniref:aldo/keto reductase n=1 Tax=Dyella sp. TaxID=1869338 RepID=UPI002C3041FB|nr:aldo/keto reductase [Dyella sp.]HTV85843.1 aldo/keto reductase [Dyella sp.]